MNLSPPFPASVADYDALKVKDVSSGLVSRNFESGNCILDDSSGATSAFVTGVHNKDQTNAGLNISVPSGTNGFRMQQPFTGRKIGIRYRRNSGTPEFGVRGDK